MIIPEKTSDIYLSCQRNPNTLSETDTASNYAHMESLLKPTISEPLQKIEKPCSALNMITYGKWNVSLLKYHRNAIKAIGGK